MKKYLGSKDNEVFIGNVETDKGIPDHLKVTALSSIRLGDSALDINGHHLPDHRPMFICRTQADAYDRLMMKRTFPNQFARQF